MTVARDPWVNPKPPVTSLSPPTGHQLPEPILALGSTICDLCQQRTVDADFFSEAYHIAQQDAGRDIDAGEADYRSPFHHGM